MTTPDEVLAEFPPWGYALSSVSEYCYFAKEDVCCGEAWAAVPKPVQGLNPWRKKHTENYWVWYRLSPPTSS